MDQQQDLQLFARAFNVGYHLRKFTPELFDKLVGGIQTKSDFFNYFVEGGEEMEKEIKFEKLRQRHDGREVDRSIEP